MSLFQQLHQEEKNKNYKKYCEIADKLLSNDEFYASPVLKKQIRLRRDFYLNELLYQRSNPINIYHILEKLNHDSHDLLQKCCPRFDELGFFQRDKTTLASTNQLGCDQDKILDALITKNKDLKIVWDSQNAKAQEEVYYFQVLLDLEFGLIQLKHKVSETNECTEDELIQLDNEFMPIFVVGFNQVLGDITYVKLIPFPSSLRGSYHYAELVNLCSEFSGISAVDEFSKNLVRNKNCQRINKISVNSGNYDVGIVYTNEDFRKWVNLVHGISITKDISLDDDNNVLLLPQNSFPTISLIVNGFDSFCDTQSVDTANVLIVDDSDFEPVYKLSAKLPEKVSEDKEQVDIVFPSITNQSMRVKTNSVLSILQSNNESLALYPILRPVVNSVDNLSSPDVEVPEILVIVKITDTSSFGEEFILSLMSQRNVHISRFIFLVDARDENKLKAKYKTIIAQWNWKIKATFNSDEDYLHLVMKKISNTLFINQYLVMRDPNTLSILANNLKKYQSFSSGCMMNHLQSSKKRQLYSNNSSGLHLSFNSYGDTGRIVLQAKNVIKSLPPAEISVFSNHYDFGLYDTKLLLAYGFKHDRLSNMELFLAQASCQALLNDIYNVCTTKICATYLRSPTLNMSLTIDSQTSKDIIENLSSIINKVTSITNLLS